MAGPAPRRRRACPDHRSPGSATFVVAISTRKRKTLSKHMPTGKTTKRAASPSVPFRAADHLRSDVEIAAYIESMLADGDARAVPIALRTVANAVGGMAALAEKTGLSRETLYRTL